MSSLPDFTTVCAALVADPWCLPLEQIARLTDYQIYKVYFHPRDERGQLENASPSLCLNPVLNNPEDPREILMTYGKILGIPQEELEDVWNSKHGNGK